MLSCYNKYMTERYGIAEARNKLSKLVDEVEQMHTRHRITKHGADAAVLMSVHDLESVVTTVEIYSLWAEKPSLREQFEQALEDVKHGRLSPIEDLMKKLDARLQQ